MRTKLLAITIGALALACTHEPRPGESVGEVCTLANDGEEVTASGYVVAPFLTVSCKYDCSVDLSPSRERTEPSFSLDFPVGDGPGTMDPIGWKGEKPTQFGQIQELKRSDFRLRDDTGTPFTLGDVVRVTGVLESRMVSNGERLVCTMDVSKVEKL
ncbi:hypothetical protein PPSIR1_01452 [Plesiocystis pacifica SIR-1]|uniref:Lipoprotein n=1 Tax=Plesiocystis pacifica SIR-1 TaxID=391625 RepID=A6G8E1_9BACT|nr:hypothetical protein [Plesiocystis pacifica]EDM77851.1 hypothetical protein PPSIR1_01452 [Plesiocystis pacifica SIR-1]